MGPPAMSARLAVSHACLLAEHWPGSRVISPRTDAHVDCSVGERFGTVSTWSNETRSTAAPLPTPTSHRSVGVPDFLTLEQYVSND